MFFILSKILHFLLVPLNWIFLLFIISLFCQKNKKKWILCAAIGLLYIYSTDFLLNLLLKQWETAPVSYAQVEGNYEAAIVLGGMAAPGKKPADRTHFPGSPDRLLHAMQLYKLGKVNKIIITGGSGELIGKKIPEAAYLKNTLLLCQVRETDILIENRSRNTYENAAFTKQLCDKTFPQSNAKFIVVTSAWHMKRSLACFKKAGFTAMPFSTDSQTPESLLSPASFLPNPSNPGRWQVLIHEVFGFITYKLSGYI